MQKRIEELDENFRVKPVRIEEGAKWISATNPNIQVNGLPWFEENRGAFLRFPKRAKGVVRDVVWELSTLPSGGRLRFKTDSTSLKLRVQHSRGSLAMPHMCAVGVSGIDLYEGPPENMVYWCSNKPTEPQAPYVCSYFEKLSERMREFTLYLPTYNDLVLLEIGIDADATIELPSPFRLPKPVVFYGTSITQGGCSSRGANGFVPLVGRTLGVDVVNLGFSGNGKSEPEVAELIAEIDAACFVNDCIANMSVELMNERYVAFNEIIRSKHPDTPLLLMTSIRFAAEHFMPKPEIDEKNAIVKATYDRIRNRGDQNVHFLDCTKAIGIEADHPSVDGSHLTDLGFKRLADVVAPVLKQILKLS